MKEAYYFSHDSNARNDEKILMLRAEHGWEGYGIYWALIEMMFENADTCLSKRNIRGIAVSYNIDITLLQSVINTCISEELFYDSEEEFWSDSLRRRKQKYHEIKNQKSEAGKKGMAKRWGFDKDDITNENKCYNDVITKNNKGNEIKGNEINKTKEDTLLQIENLRQRYSKDDLTVIDNYLDILKWTRKNGRIADSVILKIYTEWEKYPLNKVIYALNVYIGNSKYHDKKESYCYGIMRNSTADEIEGKKSHQQEAKSMYPEL